jgi:hypothetical protein
MPAATEAKSPSPRHCHDCLAERSPAACTNFTSTIPPAIEILQRLKQRLDRHGCSVARRGDRRRAGLRGHSAGPRGIETLTECWRRRLFFRRSIRPGRPRAIAESWDTDSQDRMDQQSIAPHRPMVDERLTGERRPIAWHASARPEAPAIPLSGPVGPTSHTRLSAGPGHQWLESIRTASGLIFSQPLPPKVTILDGPCDPGSPSGAPAGGRGFPQSHGPSEGRINVIKVDASLLFAARPSRATIPWYSNAGPPDRIQRRRRARGAIGGAIRRDGIRPRPA